MDILIYGIINSVSLALMALGFTLVYGVSRLPNFAHGALYVLTGYMTWIFMNRDQPSVAAPGQSAVYAVRFVQRTNSTSRIVTGVQGRLFGSFQNSTPSSTRSPPRVAAARRPYPGLLSGCPFGAQGRTDAQPLTWAVMGATDNRISFLA